MSRSELAQSNSNIDDLFPCISCGVNADPADGFGKCTCGNEAKREAIQQELLKARIAKLENVLSQDMFKNPNPTVEQKILNLVIKDHITNLQAQLKERKQ